jgi:glycolate oxidase FAD binding subunit
MAGQIEQADRRAMELRQTLMPNTVEALSQAIRQWSMDRIPFAPIGSGSKRSWGQGLREENLQWVSTAGLDQVIDHAAGDLTVTVQAGMKFADLQARLIQSGQFWAIDPSYEDRATVGGIIATADSGALRHRYNSVRDMVLGVEFVRSDGERVKAGGRVVKNVAGYDLMKLLTGSYGTLGILTQVTLRLYPLQEASRTVWLSGAGQAVLSVMQAILNSGLTPTAIDLLSATASEKLGFPAAIGLLVRIQGLAESVTEQVQRLQSLGESQGLSIAVPSEEAALWQQLGTVMTAGDRASEKTSGDASRVLCKWAVRSAETVRTIESLQRDFPGAIARFHVGSGLGQVQFPAITTEALTQVRSMVEAKGGFLTILEAPDELKASIEVWGYRGNGLGWMRSIRQQFDPNGLLSPGRMN